MLLFTAITFSLMFEDKADDTAATAVDLETDLCLVFWIGIAEYVDMRSTIFQFARKKCDL